MLISLFVFHSCHAAAYSQTHGFLWIHMCSIPHQGWCYMYISPHYFHFSSAVSESVLDLIDIKLSWTKPHFANSQGCGRCFNLILHQIKWSARVFVSFSHSMNYHTALCCSRIHGKRLQLTSYLFINPTRKQLPRVSRWPSTGGIVTFIHRNLSLPVRANKQTEAVRMVSSPGKAWSMGWGFDGILRSRPHWPGKNHYEF